jgi:fumarate reductase flavoprotein subunit
MRRIDRIEVDIAIVGGGACGTMTALRASQNRNCVVGVFEKSQREGCNAEISSGSLSAGGTRFQRSAGIIDSPQSHAQDIMHALGDASMHEIVLKLCEAAPRYVEWISDDLGYPLDVGTDMPRAGMSVPRLHADPARRGGAPLMSFLKRELKSRPNVAFVDEARTTSIMVVGGVVSGITIMQNGNVTEVFAPEVVLATGGFAANPVLMKRHCPGLGNPYNCGCASAVGDALVWLEELDADFRNFGSCLRHGQVVLGHGTRLSPALPFLGAVILDLTGRRLIDEESVGYSSLAEIIQQEPGERVAMIWDEEAMTKSSESELMRESISANSFRMYNGIEGLAEQFEASPLVIADSLEPRPGRRGLVAPYYLAWLTHGVLTTQGGAVVDSCGRVKDKSGAVIQNLRAGGDLVVGLCGSDSKGYSSGNGLLMAFGMGWIIGNALS